ncbi:MAG TPA: hypothetical protein VF011_20615 [Terriglobales bacterium]
MKMRTLLLAILAVALVFAAWAPAASAQSSFIPVTPQSLNLGNNGVGTLTGVKITAVKSTTTGHLLASGIAFVNTPNGTLVGTFNNAPLTATTTAPASGTSPATAAATTCPILNLTIGPINLNLLGLVVRTNTIHLSITAVEAPGNLLGNLLCAVANLLNQVPPPLNQIVTLLNEILAQL